MQVNWHFLTAFSLLVTCLSNKQDDEAYSSDPLFEAVVLNTTNEYRQVHNASRLLWNQTLSGYAEHWSRGCELRHSRGPYGENLALGYSNVSAAVTAWGEERHQYDFDKPQYSSMTGHFTQLVWKATTSVGCGRSRCQDGSRLSRWLVVCEYYVAGNVLGEFSQNVQRALPAPHNKTKDGTEAYFSKELGHTRQRQNGTECRNSTRLSDIANDYGVGPALDIELWVLIKDH